MSCLCVDVMGKPLDQCYSQPQCTASKNYLSASIAEKSQIVLDDLEKLIHKIEEATINSLTTINNRVDETRRQLEESFVRGFVRGFEEGLMHRN